MATTQDPLPQRQNTPSPANENGIAASRSEPVIYDYPGSTRNLNVPTPIPATAPKRTITPLAKEAGNVRSHTVQSGDTLWGLSKKYGVSIEAIRSANAMTTDTIKPGQVLKIP